MMKAAFITGHGGNEVVEVRHCEKPQRQPDDILIQIKAATLNQVDLYMRNSGAGITHQLPQIMGVDGAGVVAETDETCSYYANGQSVVLFPALSCGECEFCQQGDQSLCRRIQFLGEQTDGTFAEWISVPAANVFPMPGHLTFAEGAALGVNFLTAWRMLFTKAQLKPWETVLVFGVGGGVSLAAMQLAKAAGARVIVTSRDTDKLDRALAMGADAAINSQQQDVAKAALEYTNGRGVDVVIENIGEAVWSQAMKSLVRGGRLVTCGATSGAQPGADLQRLFVRQLQIFGSTGGTLAEFRDLLSFVQHHRIQPVIDSVFSLKQIHNALNHLESGKKMGKVALNLCEDSHDS
ncbi:zinc-binding dehydrogenase [Marinobacter fuscus]|nr:zinc-binding dehydrogenase [Marinobacter fuscus]